MPGLGGSSRDDARPFIYPSMFGMPKSEKQRRAKSELGKAKAAQNKELKLMKQAREAYQSGKYSYGAKKEYQSKQKALKSLTHTFRAFQYKKDK